jgi:hypothetical protein
VGLGVSVRRLRDVSSCLVMQGCSDDRINSAAFNAGLATCGAQAASLIEQLIQQTAGGTPAASIDCAAFEVTLTIYDAEARSFIEKLIQQAAGGAPTASSGGVESADSIGGAEGAGYVCLPWRLVPQECGAVQVGATHGEFPGVSYDPHDTTNEEAIPEVVEEQQERIYCSSYLRGDGRRVKSKTKDGQETVASSSVVCRAKRKARRIAERQINRLIGKLQSDTSFVNQGRLQQCLLKNL